MKLKKLIRTGAFKSLRDSKKTGLVLLPYDQWNLTWENSCVCKWQRMRELKKKRERCFHDK